MDLIRNYNSKVIPLYKKYGILRFPVSEAKPGMIAFPEALRVIDATRKNLVARLNALNEWNTEPLDNHAML